MSLGVDNGGGGRITELDGLRAFAVAVVMLSHYFPELPSGGAGVNVFFVLSGLVITRALMAELKFSGDLDVRRFYVRRMWRLWPALWTLIGVYSVVLCFAVGSKWWQVAAAVFNVTNVTRAFDILPFSRLDHTWSLAVEEQFYLIWPMCFLWLSGRRRPCLILGLAIGAAILWREWLIVNGASAARIYNGIDTRADSLLIGCLCALAALSLPKQITRLWWIPAIYLGIKVVSPDESGLGYILLSGTSAWLVLAAMSAPPALASILNSRFAQWGGSRSYSLYLWHMLVFTVGNHLFPWPPVRVVGSFLLACLVAEASYRFIEQPFRRGLPAYLRKIRKPAMVHHAATV